MYNLNMEFSHEIEGALTRVVRALDGLNAQCVLVGGAVRDALLGHEAKDLDIEVFGVSADDLESALRNEYGDDVHAVGRAFCVFKIAFHVRRNGIHDIDVSIPRRESKAGEGHTDFEVTGDPRMSFEDAARRRDFTINAIGFDLHSRELLDPFGGKADLEKQILRVVDPATFPDDPLRVYRAVQFVARFGLTPEPNTEELLRSMVEEGVASHLSEERVGEEFEKLLVKAERPSLGLAFASELGLIERAYPELHVLKATRQDPEWHPEGDVWTHTLMVVDQAAKIIRDSKRSFSEREKRQVMYGALCHDLGKPETTEKIDGRIRSRGHSEAGVPLTEALLSRHAVAYRDREAVMKLVKAHLVPGALYKAHEKGELSDDQYVGAVRKLMCRLDPVDIEVLLATAEADFRGRDFPTADEPEYLYGKKMRDAIEQSGLRDEGLSTLLSGDDVMALGIKEGPEVGRAIQIVEDARERGDVRTKEEAIEYLQKHLP